MNPEPEPAVNPGSDVGSSPGVAAIADFWAWWPSVAARYAAVLDGDSAAVQGLTTAEIIPELTERVHAIDPALVWEFGPGSEGTRHCLTVTAAGVPEHRPVARRWLDAAPAPTAAWSFLDLRAARPGATVRWKGVNYDPEQLRIGVRAGHSVVNVTVWHPHWGSARTAPLREGLFGGASRFTVEGASGVHNEADGSTAADPEIAVGGQDIAPDLRAAFLMLDAALGEAAVSTWLGEIEAADHCPDGAVTVGELRSLVTRMAAGALTPEGVPTWTVLHYEREGGPETVRTIVPVTSMVAPACDLHIAVRLSIDPVAASDLTGAQIMERIAALEDALTSAVEERGVGLLVAVVTHGGAAGDVAHGAVGGAGVAHGHGDVAHKHGAVDGHGDVARAASAARVIAAHGVVGGAGGLTGSAASGAMGSAVTLHLYLNSAAREVDAARTTVRVVVSTWGLGEAAVEEASDPSWAAVRPFRV